MRRSETASGVGLFRLGHVRAWLPRLALGGASLIIPGEKLERITRLFVSCARGELAAPDRKGSQLIRSFHVHWPLFRA